MMLALLLLLAGACSSAERMGYQVKAAGVAYDTTRDSKTPGLYQAQGVYDTAAADKGRVKPEEVRWRALFNGLQTLQKDGYDSATVAGPAGMRLNRTVTYTRSGASVTTDSWPGFAYALRGYRKDEAAPPSARPIAQLMDEANGRAHAAAAK